MRDNRNKYIAPTLLTKLGAQYRFNFTPFEEYSFEITNNFHFLTGLSQITDIIDGIDRTALSQGDQALLDETRSFLQQEIESATIAFDNKNGVVRL